MRKPAGGQPWGGPVGAGEGLTAVQGMVGCLGGRISLMVTQDPEP